MNDRNLNPAYCEALAAARGVALAPARSWSILLTSANHGVVGPLGHPFNHAGEKHERVQVMEIVEAGAAPAPGADLGGLVRISIDGTVTPLATSYAPVDASTVLTDDRIKFLYNASFALTAPQHRHDAAVRFARAIERDVAAQAGQVAVPEGWILVPKMFVSEVRRAAEIADSYSPSIDSIDEHGGEECEEPIWQIHHILYYAHAKLFGSRAAAPSAPAVAQQAPAPGQAEIEWSHDVQERLIAAGDGESDEVRGLMAEAASLLAALTGRPAQASTAGERQEGGDHA